MLGIFLSSLSFAATLAGVEMPNHIQSENRELHLNGMGLRERLSFDIYVAGLYAPFKSSDPSRLLRHSIPKQIHCEIIFPKVPKSRMISTMTDNLKNNPDVSPEVAQKMQSLLSSLDDLVKGDKMSFEYHPKTGLTLKINGEIKGHDTDKDFISGVFGMYLGDYPVSKNLKSGLLGEQ